MIRLYAYQTSSVSYQGGSIAFIKKAVITIAGVFGTLFETTENYSPISAFDLEASLALPIQEIGGLSFPPSSEYGQ